MNISPLTWYFAWVTLLCTASFAAVQLPQVIITELYRDPAGSEDVLGGGASHEFVEFVNTGTVPLAIDSLFISNGAEADSVMPVWEEIPGHASCVYTCELLPVGSVAVIIDPDYLSFCSTSIAGRLPFADGTVLLQCGDREFGQSGLAADHGVVLYKGTKTSIGRILAEAADNMAGITSPVGTILRLSQPKNREGVSVSSNNIFAGTAEWEFTGNNLDPGQLNQLESKVLLEPTFGAFDKEASQLSCTLRVAVLSDTLLRTLPFTVYSVDHGKKAPLADDVFNLTYRTGEAVLRLPIDGKEYVAEAELQEALAWPLNWQTAVVPAASIVFTEIFPRASTWEPEWIELYNRTSVPFDLYGYTLVIGEDSVAIAEKPLVLPPESFMVVTGSLSLFRQKYPSVSTVYSTATAWRALDNGSDTLKLLAKDRTLVDSMGYFAGNIDFWPAVSLERQDEEQTGNPVWVPSQSSAPGSKNTPVVTGRRRQEWIDIAPIPFTPDGDGKDDELTITTAAPPGASVSVTIYGCDGRILHEVDKSTTRISTWNGRGKHGAAPVGPFFVVADIRHDGKDYLVRKKGILWRR